MCLKVLRYPVSPKGVWLLVKEQPSKEQPSKKQPSNEQPSKKQSSKEHSSKEQLSKEQSLKEQSCCYYYSIVKYMMAIWTPKSL